LRSALQRAFAITARSRAADQIGDILAWSMITFSFSDASIAWKETFLATSIRLRREIR
jgi:hypothetical protein